MTESSPHHVSPLDEDEIKIFNVETLPTTPSTSTPSSLSDFVRSARHDETLDQTPPRDRIKSLYSSFTSYNNMDFSSVLNDPKEALNGSNSSLLSLALFSSWFNSTTSPSPSTINPENSEILHDLSSEDFSFIESLSSRSYEDVKLDRCFRKGRSPSTPVTPQLKRSSSSVSSLSSSSLTTPINTQTNQTIAGDEIFENYLKMLEKYPSPKDLLHSNESQLSQRRINENILDYMVRREGIPSYFFDAQYELSRSEYFNKVFSSENESASLLLQEKLSYYLDQIESQVQKQVNFKSADIFEAMMKYDDLYETMLQSLPLVQELRKRISQYEHSAVLKPLQVANLVRKKQNLAKTLELVKIIDSINQSMAATKEIISQHGDLLSSIDILSTIESTIHQHPDLSNVSCLKHIHKEIQVELKVIDEMIKQELAEMISSLLSRDSPINMDELALRLDSTLKSILHRDLVAPVIITLKKQISTSIDETFIKCMAPFKSSPLDDRKSIPNNLEPQIFNDLFSSITKNCLFKLEQFSHFSKVVDQFCQDILSKTDANTDKIVINSVKLKTLNREVQKILTFMNDTIQQLCSQVCASMDKSIVKFTNPALARYMTIAREFIDACDNVALQKSTILKGKMLSQGQAYLDDFHNAFISRLKKRLKKDNWEAVPTIPTKYLKCAMQLIGSKEEVAEDKPAAFIQTNGIKFKLSTSCLCLMKFIYNYTQLLSRDYAFISSIDVHSRILQLMQVYNMDLRELVLMAKARDANSNIATITPKHLILASDCIHYLIVLLPYVQTKMEEALQDGQKKQYVKFNEFVKDLVEHRSGIFEKIILILTDALKHQTTEIPNFNWENKENKASPFITMIKQTNSVHRTICSSTFLTSNNEEMKRYSGRVYDLLLDQICEAVATNMNTVFNTEGVKLRAQADLVTVGKEIQKRIDSFVELPKVERLSKLF